MDTDQDNWLSDNINPDLRQLYHIAEVVYDGQTKYQHVQILRLGAFGMSLVLDGKIQSTETDEFIYHEALVQPALLAHPGPKSVFIAGGGEGATLREVLTHRTVRRVVMVDIDAGAVALSRKYLPGHSQGAFEDKRTELRHEDARAYLERSRERFDAIIIDLPDPIEGGPAYLLFTQEFYQMVQERLTANGVIALQAGSAYVTELLNLTSVYHTLRSVFPVVAVYKADVPCFGGPWAFCLASNKLDPSLLSPAEIDARIAARSLRHLRFYDGMTHQGMFALPRYIRTALARPQRLITDKEPIFIYRQA